MVEPPFAKRYSTPPSCSLATSAPASSVGKAGEERLEIPFVVPVVDPEESANHRGGGDGDPEALGPGQAIEDLLELVHELSGQGEDRTLRDAAGRGCDRADAGTRRSPP